MIHVDYTTNDAGQTFLTVWSGITAETVASAVIEGEAPSETLHVTYAPERITDAEWAAFVKECHAAAGEAGAGIKFTEGQPLLP